MSQRKTDWKLVRGTWISTEPALPGVWRRKEGGHVVRARAVNGATGKLKDIWKVLPTLTAATALQWLEEERARVNAGTVSTPAQQMRFAEFAASLFEEKVKLGELKSAKSREKWGHVLEHLIAGTHSEALDQHVQGFGEFFLDKLDTEHIAAWKVKLSDLIAAGDYSPVTINGWLAILRVIMKAAKRRLKLQHLATEDIDNFDTSEHSGYSPEEPNALTPDEVAVFMEEVRRTYPQHYAMTYLGLATGLRPSSLRPLRRGGPDADVLWDQRRLLVRRSQTVGDEVMNTTKQKVRYAIDLPEQVLEVLRWHVETQLVTPEQLDSDLLFPSVNGGFRSPCVLNKPFADVVQTLEFGKAFTQRGLRRTFNDLARAARVEALITRSISGHNTDRMHELYSTVQPGEQRDGIARVIHLFQHRVTGSSGEGGGEDRASGGEDHEKTG